ncbi:MAG: high-potential iron-sulfur protein [Nitrosomonas ureae]
MTNHSQKKFSRRRIMKFMALGATIPIFNVLMNHVHASKASKESMQYRDEPNGKEQCDNCMQFIPGKTPEAQGECRVVEGSINPQGWCAAYTKK